MAAFAGLAPTPESHFQLRFFGAVLALREQVPGEVFPFLADYCADLDAAGVGDLRAFTAAVRAWEAAAGDLPLLRLALAVGHDPADLDALLLLGLVDEDARFAAVFEHYIGHPRPSLGLLNAWWPQWRVVLRRLAELGLVTSAAWNATDPSTPVAGDAAVVPPLVWEVVRGERPTHLAPWARYRAPDSMVGLADLILDPRLDEQVRRLPVVLEAGAAGALIVRGPQGSGRRTLVGAVARARGRGLLEVEGLPADDQRWRAVGALSRLLDAVPVAVVDGEPGFALRMPELPGRIADMAVVCGPRTQVRGPAIQGGVTVELGLPGPAERARHWQAALGSQERSAELAGRFRMTGGCIRQVAALARAEAALAGLAQPGLTQVARAASTLHSQLLNAHATRVATRDSWADLAVNPATLHELQLLEARCRHRERLADAVGPAAAGGLTAGVRALFSGPSGTGKTLAARTLAGVLAMDLYRLDVASVVNKYLGETEKNLERVFSLAEEADVALLIDEGDALLTQRTAVRTSNDRYANLETNFLLQRLESFEGILIITTNAGERIDDAFRRRMDIGIEFALPDEFQRWLIWCLHLPVNHGVPAVLLEELAQRCALTGGQIRNAVLHAGLLALDRDRVIGPDELAPAVRREYVKAGEVCPLSWEVHVG